MKCELEMEMEIESDRDEDEGWGWTCTRLVERSARHSSRVTHSLMDE